MPTYFLGSVKLAFALMISLAAPAALAQTSLGGADPVSPSPPPSVVPAPTPQPSQRLDYIPNLPKASEPDPTRPDNSADKWAAIAFTADGSYSSIWAVQSRPEAEAFVAKQCASYGRGGCQVVVAFGRQCVGLSTYRGGRWVLSFTAGGMTFPEAQAASLDRCNSDSRSRGRCQFRTAACADGR
jgi:uncharacterized protein DUF4189